MPNRVILVTGTPCIGKTTLAQKLAKRLHAQYINLTDFAEKNSLIQSADPARDTKIIDETKMRRKLKTLIAQAQTDLIIDGHYAAAVAPKTAVTNVLVLRRHPQQLQQLMQKRGYTQQKQDENLAAEILDVCLTEALQKQPRQSICEIDTTNKTPNDVLQEALAILQGKKPCCIGTVDWLGKLEQEGKLNQYLKE